MPPDRPDMTRRRHRDERFNPLTLNSLLQNTDTMPPWLLISLVDMETAFSDLLEG